MARGNSVNHKGLKWPVMVKLVSTQHRNARAGSRSGPAKLILDPYNVILAQIRARLNLDQLEQDFPGV